MTKTIVLGVEPTEKKKTKIEFVKVLTEYHTIKEHVNTLPKRWNYIELVSKDYGEGMDLMFAYDDPNKRKDGTLYIGYWNDGVVE